MSSWIALSRTDHKEKHWRPRQGFEFVAAQHVVPVIIAELAKILPHYATGFIKGNDGSYQFVALVGLGGDRNLYITKKSQWLCSYVPASLRGYPFALLSDGEGKKVLCLDETHLSDDDGLPRIFNDNGQLSELVSDAMEFISKCEQNRLLTVKACAVLSDAGLIEPWPIAINRAEGDEPWKIDGLNRINEAKLSMLDTGLLGSLRDVGALSLAYAQLLSMAQIDQLTQRSEYHAKEGINSGRKSELEGLFSSDDLGSLNFDVLNYENDNT